MSIHHNINIPAVDMERLWGAASIHWKQADTDVAKAFWYGAASVFEMMGWPDPPSHNTFVAELENRLENGEVTG